MPTAVDSDSPDRGPIIMGILWSLTLVAVSTISVRVYIRMKLDALSWDDWLVVIAVLFQLVDVSFITKACTFGLGKHDGDLAFDQLVNALKWAWLGMIPGTFVAVLGRVSSAVLLIRLFGVRSWFKWYLIIFTTMQSIGGALVLLVHFIGVRPIGALWNPTIQATRLSSNIALDTAYIVQALFTFADLTYVLLPVIIIWRLNMSLSRRFGLILLMCTSLITVAASILKAITLQTVSADYRQPQYSASLAALLVGIEQTLVVIMASVPALRAISKVDIPIFSHLSSKVSSGFGLNRRKGTLGIGDRYLGESSCYHDLEHNRCKPRCVFEGADKKRIGMLPNVIADASYPKEESSQSLVPEEKAAYIRRTDQFSVSVSYRGQ
ncbi:MAG: hypothetical protein Q9160_005155 [Pyrenula sp. 1 TL-2023]